MATGTLRLKLAAAASLLLLVGLGIYLAPLRPGVVALQLTFTPEAFVQVLQAWGPEGVQRFRSHLLVDGLLLLNYGAAGYWAVTRTRFFQPLAPRLPLRWVALVLPFAAVCDAGEDLLHWMLTGANALAPAVTMAPALYLLAGACATLKWLGIAGFVISAIYRLRSRSRCCTLPMT
ncbi:hypothetical protein [uncultured Rhodoferax sp.]|uniref:hypothetical protein n=1 Tax=uncultured Rhodoferax sp. TaxID=223188 RepID=UPI0025EBD48E|nr:hypothetical protein [uncultured Rhodoferax sp.]